MTSTLDWMAKRITEIEQAATDKERERILKLLYDQNIIRDCAATGKPVAFTTDGTEVVYIKELKGENK